MNAYFKKPSSSPISCDDDSDFDEENVETSNNISVGQDKNTGMNLV